MTESGNNLRSTNALKKVKSASPKQKDNTNRRTVLSHERIIRAALDLIDKKGLNALSMRDLGVSLGASTMSVYRYFSNKAALLDAIVDQIIADMALTSKEASWHDQLRTIALRARSAILTHPNLAPLFTREFRRSPTSIYVNSTFIEQMRASGIPPALLAETYWAIACYANGYALLEARCHAEAKRQTSNQEERIRRSRQLVRTVDGIPSQTIEDLARVIAHPIGEAQFLFGLDCLIFGIEKKIILHENE